MMPESACFDSLLDLLQSKQWPKLNDYLNDKKNIPKDSVDGLLSRSVKPLFNSLATMLDQLDYHILSTNGDIITLVYILNVARFVTLGSIIHSEGQRLLIHDLLQQRAFETIHKLNELADSDDELLVGLFSGVFLSTGSDKIIDKQTFVKQLISTLRKHTSFYAITCPYDEDLYNHDSMIVYHVPDWKSILDDFDPTRELLQPPNNYIPHPRISVKFQSWYIRRYQPRLTMNPNEWYLHILDSGVRFGDFTREQDITRELFQWIFQHYHCDLRELLYYTTTSLLHNENVLLLFLTFLDEKQFYDTIEHFITTHYYYPIEIALEHNLWTPSPLELRRLIHFLSITIQDRDSSSSLRSTTFRHPFSTKAPQRPSDTMKSCFQRTWANILYGLLWDNSQLSNDTVRLAHARTCLTLPIDGYTEKDVPDVMNDLLTFGDLRLMTLAEKVFQREWTTDAYYIALITSKDTNHATILNYLTKKGCVMTDQMRGTIINYLEKEHVRSSCKINKWIQQFSTNKGEEKQEDRASTRNVKEKGPPKKKARKI